MFSLLLSLLLSMIMLPGYEFFSSLRQRLELNAAADEDMFHIGEILGTQFQSIVGINTALELLHTACVSNAWNPYAVAALRTQAEVLRHSQEAVLRSIPYTHMHRRPEANIHLQSHHRSPAPCSMPGTLRWISQYPYTLNGEFYGLKIHQNTYKHFTWSFYHPEVKAL